MDRRDEIDAKVASQALPTDLYNALQAACDLVDPPIYYADSPMILLGQVIEWKGDNFFPPCIYVHPYDLWALREQFSGRRWKHIRDRKLDPMPAFRSMPVERIAEPDPKLYQWYGRYGLKGRW